MKEDKLGEGLLGEERQRKSDNFLWGLLFVLIVLAFVFFGARIYIGKNFSGVVVKGTSMNTTLYDGERLIMKYTDEDHKAERGDIIIVYVGDYDECRDVDGGHLIKRLIATEGDTVRCTDGQILIRYKGSSDWTALNEPYAYYGENDSYKTEYDFDAYTVGEGEVFFLGDNRSSDGSSLDSRYKEGKSHLQNKLYKESDIVGYIPDWAIKHQSFFAKLPIW